MSMPIDRYRLGSLRSRKAILIGINGSDTASEKRSGKQRRWDSVY